MDQMSGTKKKTVTKQPISCESIMLWLIKHKFVCKSVMLAAGLAGFYSGVHKQFNSMNIRRTVDGKYVVRTSDYLQENNRYVSLIIGEGCLHGMVTMIGSSTPLLLLFMFM